MKRSILFHPRALYVLTKKRRAVDKSIVIDIKRHGIRNSIRNLCDAFLARGRRKNDCRISTVEPKKINAVHPRLPGASIWPKGGRTGSETKGVRAVESIRSARSIPEANRIAVVLPPRLLRIVSWKRAPTCIKIALLLLLSPPPPSPGFFPNVLWLEAQHSSVTTDDRPEFDRFSFGNLACLYI